MDAFLTKRRTESTTTDPGSDTEDVSDSDFDNLNDEKDFTAPRASPASGDSVSQHDLFLANQKIQNQIAYELLAFGIAKFSMNAADARSFFNLLKEVLFQLPLSCENTVGPGTKATVFQKNLGAFLSEKESQRWVAWFLAYPVNRNHPGSILELAEQLEADSNTLSQNAAEVQSFFSDNQDLERLYERSPISAVIKSHYDTHSAKMPEAMQQDPTWEKPVLFAMTMSVATSFVLIQSTEVVARRKEPIEEINMSFPLDVYSITPFGLGLAQRTFEDDIDKFLQSFSEEQSPFNEFGLAKDFNLGGSYFTWTALPWRTSISFLESISLGKEETIGRSLQSTAQNLIGVSYRTDEKALSFANNMISLYSRVNTNVQKTIKDLEKTISTMKQTMKARRR